MYKKKNPKQKRSKVAHWHKTEEKTCVRLHTLFGEGLGESPQARQAVGSQLVEDAGQHLCQLLGLSVAGDGEGVGGQRGLHFGVVEVDDCSLVCEHVHLE